MEISLTDRKLKSIVHKVIGHLDVQQTWPPIRVTNMPDYWAFIQPLTLATHDKDPTILDCHYKLAADRAREIKNDKINLRVWFMKEPGCPRGVVIMNAK